MPYTNSGGVPGEFLLVFTLLLWLLFFFIYFSNRKNKLNFWCFISGMCFSIGIFKEYWQYTLLPRITDTFPDLISEAAAFSIYSILTAIPYYLAMPCALAFCMYYCRIPETYPKAFPWLLRALFLPVFLFGCFYPYWQTRYFQLNDANYYLLVTLYNLSYGIILTVLLLRTLFACRRQSNFKSNLIVAVFVLLPTWYTMLTVFPAQLFHLSEHEKAWQGNLFIMLIIIAIYFRQAFRGGVMGVQLQCRRYDWNQENQIINQGAQLSQHAVKNEVAKIEWCAKKLEDPRQQLQQAELSRIILNATERLKDYVFKAWSYSQDVILHPAECDVAPLLKQCIDNFAPLYPRIQVPVQCPPAARLICDRGCVAEMLNNLLQNAAEAMQEQGELLVNYQPQTGRKGAILSVTDSGSGIAPSVLLKLFTPYYSTKSGSQHMGLGLYYCRNVMHKHGGDISVESQLGRGTTFTLSFPPVRARRKKPFRLSKKGGNTHELS